jgi:glyoxylase-like metal-dependent hydrolase (beta-lactamase superfamily II)
VINDTKTIFQSRRIAPDTWHITGDGCSSYLLAGDERALMIDTGFAVENIQAYAQTLTDKPVEYAANTHGHFDHTGGNGWFKQAYMSAEAAKIAKIPYPSMAEKKFPLEYSVIIVKDGDTIDLGGRTLEVFKIPAHAPSSLAFLDKKGRIMFTGDEVDNHVMLVWMQDEPQPAIEQYVKNLSKLLAHRGDFDYICAGHDQVMGDPSLIEDYLENAKLILSGKECEPLERPAGAPEDFHMPQPEYKRFSVYKETWIGFDNRYKFCSK